MTTSQAANAALLRSLQRARERQEGVPTVTPANAALLRSLQRARERQARVPSVTSTKPVEQPIVHRNTSPTPKPPWNSAKIYRPTKTPRSVFLDANGPSEQNVVPHRVNTSMSSIRSSSNNEVTTPVKVVRMSPTVIEQPSRLAPVYVQEPSRPAPVYVQEPSRPAPVYVQQPSRPAPVYVQQPSKPASVYVQQSSRPAPVYVQQPYQTYQTSTSYSRTDPEVVVLDSQPQKQSFFSRFRRNKTYRTNYYGENEVLLNQSKSSVYRCCQCCAGGRLASVCPSCYFCELFYGCPLYCWLLTLLLLLLPLLALLGWLLSEQPAINPAKRQYVTEQTSIVESNVFDVMHNCAVPYCTYPSPATTVNVLYQTYYYYSATQITSNGNILQTLSFSVFIFLYILNKLCEIS